jgi:hypothetical protein
MEFAACLGVCMNADSPGLTFVLIELVLNCRVLCES